MLADLAEAADAEVLAHVVVREVAKAGHPDVCRNEYADRVVHLLGHEVVVQQEQDLGRGKGGGANMRRKKDFRSVADI